MTEEDVEFLMDSAGNDKNPLKVLSPYDFEVVRRLEQKGLIEVLEIFRVTEAGKAYVDGWNLYKELHD